MPRRLRQLIVPTAVIAFCFIGAWDRLLHPSAIGLIAWTWILLLTQPPLSVSEMVNDPADKRSLLFIALAGNVCLVVPTLDYSQRAAWVPQPLSPWVVGGLALAFGGLAFRVRAILVMGRQFRTSVTIDHEQQLIQNGPYRLLRHPSYAGALLGFAGVSVMLRSLWGGLALLSLMLPAYAYRIKVEEAALLERFGERYAEFCAKRARLIPTLY